MTSTKKSLLFSHMQAAHRRQTLVIAMFYSIWPRLTLFYVYSFNYYEVFLPFMRYHFPSHKELEVGEEDIWRKGVVE